MQDKKKPFSFRMDAVHTNDKEPDTYNATLLSGKGTAIAKIYGVTINASPGNSFDDRRSH